MRPEIEEVKNEKSLDVQDYQELLDILFSENKPLTVDEANILLRLFPKNSNDEVENNLLSVIQNIQCSRAQFSDIISNAPTEDLKSELLDHFRSLHKDNEK